jgi:hypothetical protein
MNVHVLPAPALPIFSKYRPENNPFELSPMLERYDDGSMKKSWHL